MTQTITPQSDKSRSAIPALKDRVCAERLTDQNAFRHRQRVPSVHRTIFTISTMPGDRIGLGQCRHGFHLRDVVPVLIADREYDHSWITRA
ncbi:hypothetical protein [Rhodococcus sp. NCIMB 12038]|uniref:hypothetical protein n=1 Tax=Rhodococcus sp. NCIMB 12038 TaxID=933800 RepID=UPI00117A0112|nr:hypothetical protein [Rhodococcus sp. NCIMB 12038]